MNTFQHLARLALLLSALGMLPACSKRGASYESRFHDEIMLEFPSGVAAGDAELMRERMDKSLRASKSGFVSGMMSSGKEIDFISVDTDFEKVDEEALVAGLVKDGTLPKDVKASYKRGAYQTDGGEGAKQP